MLDSDSDDDDNDDDEGWVKRELSPSFGSGFLRHYQSSHAGGIITFNFNYTF